MGKLVIIESGEYSDFCYIPLIVPDDFDPDSAIAEFKAEVKRKYPDEYERDYKVSMELSGFLVEKYQARDVTDKEVIVMKDPIRYGNLDDD